MKLAHLRRIPEAVTDAVRMRGTEAQDAPLRGAEFGFHRVPVAAAKESMKAATIPQLGGLIAGQMIPHETESVAVGTSKGRLRTEPLGAAAGASDRPPTTVWNSQGAATRSRATSTCG